MTENSDDDGRDDRGRFAKGNRASAGNPAHARLHALRRRVRDSIDAVDLEQAMKGMLVAAAAGDAAAARVAFEWSLGRPRQMDPEVDVRLGPLSSAGDFAAAFATLARAAATGEAPPDAVAAIATALRNGFDASSASEAFDALEARLRAIEEGYQA